MDATLIELVRDIDRVLDAPSTDPHSRDELLARVERLRDAWVQHRARWESDDGLYHDLTETEPRVTPAVRRLRDDSLRLLTSCEVALATIRRPDASDDDIRRVTRDVTRHVERHLSLAAAATHDAVAVDLGSDA
ncbi:MAG TPA: hypothetical protein VF183_01645 [Acidimicrobiales bacterium]